MRRTIMWSLACVACLCAHFAIAADLSLERIAVIELPNDLGQMRAESRVSVSPDGSTVVVPFEQGAATIDVATQTVRGVYQAADINSSAISPDGRSLILVGGMPNARSSRCVAVDSRDARLLFEISSTMKAQRAPIRAATFCSNTGFVTAAADGSLIYADVARKETVTLFNGGDGCVPTCVGYCAAKNWVAIGGSTQMTRVVDLNTRKVVANLGLHAGPVTSLAFSSDGAQLACGCASAVQRNDLRPTLKVWDIRTGREAAALDFSETVSSVVMLPQDRGLIAAGDNRVAAWRLSDLSGPKQYRQTLSLAVGLQSLAYVAQQDLLVGLAPGQLSLWRIQGLTPNRNPRNLQFAR